MINYNGELIAEKALNLGLENRGFKFGDGLFETIKIVEGKIAFGEDHYFRLMASMRMLRMDIGMDFTLESFEEEILKLTGSLGLDKARVRFSVFRKDGGLYLPKDQSFNYIIEASALDISQKKVYEVDLFKDHYNYSGILSTLKTNNRILNVLASIYAQENGLNNCLLLNEKKNLVEGLNANLFLVNGNVISTPALSEGCLKGIIRKNIIKLLENDSEYELQETSISPFELLKADEAFLTNSIMGVQPISNYRKKRFEIKIGLDIGEKIKNLEA